MLYEYIIIKDNAKMILLHYRIKIEWPSIIISQEAKFDIAPQRFLKSSYILLGYIIILWLDSAAIIGK